MSSPVAAPHPSAPKRGTWWRFVLPACGALALAGTLLGQPLLSLAAALVFLLAWLPSVWHRRRLAGWLGWLAIAGLLLVPAALGQARLALLALPVVCLTAAAWLFARTLRRGTEPFITRCVRVIEGDAHLDLPHVRAYTRGVTVYWAWLLASMAAMSLLLALFARPGGWFAVLAWPAPLALPGSMLAWFPEVGCWMLLATAFVAEYVFRRWHLRGVPQANPVYFVTQLIRRWPALLQDGGRAA